VCLQLALEDSQREGGKQREASGQVWQPTMFRDDGGSYRFRLVLVFHTLFFFYVHVLSSLTLLISLPYTSRYDPAQEAKVQVSLSLLVPMRVVMAQQSSSGVCSFFSAAYVFWTFVLCSSPVKKAINVFNATVNQL
jgi:hypothetical protein